MSCVRVREGVRPLSARLFVHPKALDMIGEMLEAQGWQCDNLKIVNTPGSTANEIMLDTGIREKGREYYKRGDGSTYARMIVTLLTPERA